jgi:hypothetical protein
MDREHILVVSAVAPANEISGPAPELPACAIGICSLVGGSLPSSGGQLVFNHAH